MKAKYDLDRAKLDLGKRDLVSKLEYEQAKLAVADAEQKLQEAEAKAKSDKTAAEADIVAKQRKRDEGPSSTSSAPQSGLEALQIKAPTAGVVNIMPNYRDRRHVRRRGGVPRRGSRLGRRQHPRAARPVVDPPRSAARRVRPRPPEGRAVATVKIEAVPGKDFAASVDLISVLAKVDFSSGWPPLQELRSRAGARRSPTRDPARHDRDRAHRHRRLPGALLAPTEAVFQRDGHPIVYRLRGSMFDETRVRRHAARPRTGRHCRVRRRPPARSWPPAGPIRIRSGGPREAAPLDLGRLAGVVGRGGRRARSRWPCRRCPNATPTVPTTQVARGPLKLTVYATGELRAGRTATLVAPPAGGTLRLVKLVPTGTAGQGRAKSFSRSIRPTRSSRSSRPKSELAEAEQQIVKMKADSAGSGRRGSGRAADRALRRAPRRARHGGQRSHRRDRREEERPDARRSAHRLEQLEHRRPVALRHQRCRAGGRRSSSATRRSWRWSAQVDHRQPRRQGAVRRRRLGQGKS